MKAVYKEYQRNAESSRILGQELPVPGSTQMGIKALGHSHQGKPCHRGKVHRTFEILINAEMSSTLTLSKLKLLHLSYLEECNLEISYKYFNTECQTSHFMLQFCLRTHKFLNQLNELHTFPSLCLVTSMLPPYAKNSFIFPLVAYLCCSAIFRSFKSFLNKGLSNTTQRGS